MHYLRNLSILSSITILSLLTLTPQTLAATFELNPIETLTINSKSPLTPVLSSPLLNGVRYKFEVSGTFQPDFRIPNWVVDARFVTRNNFATQNDLDPNFGNFDFGLFSNALGSNNDNFWGQYQSTSIYSFEYLGIGNRADFYVNDVSQSSGLDNAGSYTVKIFKESAPISVPEPSSILGSLLAGFFGVGSLVKRKQLFTGKSV
ncbi:PEP-CTERM sorting domain-containing protein [Nostoc sp. FACHB-892]|uniref:PEP-CTERM sorting domain-containing protein n=1 Tax=Nostoc sp. FACHB-892 TaxID=2692843 RepID=UPI0016870751|nr:PEP-CTERM sorting domain-containing protein [Nostoc sp. FACHB-892]